MERSFIPAIEGLRGVAVILVVLFHYTLVIDPRFADPWVAAIDSALAARVVVRNGMLGVDLFFLISGFLLVLPWLRHAGGTGPAPSTRDFYRRRADRILPAYYAQLLILFFVLVPLLRGLDFWRQNATYMLENLAAHVFLVHYLAPVSSPSLSINGALWTLCLEAQFYLLLPLIAPVFARAPWRTAGFLLALAIGWRWSAAFHLDALVQWIRAIEPSWALTEQGTRHFLYTQFPGYLAHFAAGMLAGRACLRWKERPPSRSEELAWLGAAALALAVLWLLHAPKGWILGEPTWILALAALSVAFLAFAARGLAASRPLLANAPLRFAGRISYSAYLYHLPILLLWNAYGPAVAGSWLVLPLYLAAVLAVSWISFRYAESSSRPSAPRRWRAPAAAPRPTAPASSGPRP